MDTVFRKAVPADAPAMASLVTLAWRKAYRGILSDELLDNRSAKEGAQRIRARIENQPEQHYNVLVADGEIVGVTAYCPCSGDDLPDAGEIRVFYIHPDRQGQGLGRRMMQNVLTALRADGCKDIVLWVFKDNRNARAFYEKMGFTADGAEQSTQHLENAVSVRYRYKGVTQT